MTTTAAAPAIDTYSARDDYRRPVTYTRVNGRTVAATVTLPKAVRTATPDRAYLTNDWTKQGVEAVSYHPTRRAALDAALVVAAKAVTA